MSIELTWGEKLTDLRNEREMTLTEVAEQTGISVSTISNYENDVGSMKVENLCKLLQVYGVKFEEFYGLAWSDYQEDLKTFQRYGFSEKFFRELVLLEKYNEHQITKCLNLLCESPLYSLTVFENLLQAFDPSNYEKLKSLSLEFSHDAAMRFLLEPVFQALAAMVEGQVPEFQS